MSEKKMVNRNVAIALGIICIILAVGLVATFAYYIPKINDIETKVDNLTSNSNSSNVTSEYTRIVLPDEGVTTYDFGKNEFSFYGRGSYFNQQQFGVSYLGSYTSVSTYSYNATVGATYELLGIQIQVSEVHSDYIVLLVKSL
jgi:hypothetical protein